MRMAVLGVISSVALFAGPANAEVLDWQCEGRMTGQATLPDGGRADLSGTAPSQFRLIVDLDRGTWCSQDCSPTPENPIVSATPERIVLFETEEVQLELNPERLTTTMIIRVAEPATEMVQRGECRLSSAAA